MHIQYNILNASRIAPIIEAVLRAEPKLKPIRDTSANCELY